MTPKCARGGGTVPRDNTPKQYKFVRRNIAERETNGSFNITSIFSVTAATTNPLADKFVMQSKIGKLSDVNIK